MCSNSNDKDAGATVLFPATLPRDSRPARRRCLGQGMWPPDELTHLLMRADGVTEAALAALLSRVAAKRAVA